MEPIPDTEKTVDHLFRLEAGKMVAVLTHVFGLAHLQLAEDVVQDSFIKALQVWKLQGLPENPQAWLMQVARNKALDVLRRKQYLQRFIQQTPPQEPSETIEAFFHQQEIADSQLRMIFACCHPALKQEDQVALTLKIVSAFSLAEIARSLLTNEAVVQKRIDRARRFLREQNMTLEIPAGAELHERLDSVYTVLYLLFNEGYHSRKADELIRRDLCAEAMRCCKLLTEHALVKCPESNALLALMCLHASRFNSRMDMDDGIILLEEQDRNLWDRELIQVGYHYLNRSSEGNSISAYHLEAAIAAEHALAPRFEDTNWLRLLGLYNALAAIKNSPAVTLNRAVVLAKSGDVDGGIQAILSTTGLERLLQTDHLYNAVLGNLYQTLNDSVRAKHFMEQALELTSSLAEIKLLQARIDALTV